MKTNIKSYIRTAAGATTLGLLLAAPMALTSCNDFLEDQTLQGVLSEDQALQPSNVEAMVVSAYASLITAEDINHAFSLWNYDVRSDDAYKGGQSEGDGGVIHSVETGVGILPSDWSINGDDGIWRRLYNFISRTNIALELVGRTDNSFAHKQERIAELKFLRAYGHFQLLRLFGHIPFIMNENMTTEEFYSLSNTEYNYSTGMQKIADELYWSYCHLPEKQAQKGRPTKASAAALMAKAYLYKAYPKNMDGERELNTFCGSVDLAAMDSVIKYTDGDIFRNYHLTADFHDNFRPEERYENGPEDIWSIQFSFNDGTVDGNRNFGSALIAPNVENATTGGHDFYKPSQNLVNAYHTNSQGLPLLNTFNDQDLDPKADNTDPRLFLTVGMNGYPFMFNPKFIQSPDWARASGIYGYYISLKQNVDLEYVGQDTYIKKCGWCWANTMNRIVLRLADVKLMRAEALIQRGRDADGMKLINEIRNRAAGSTAQISNYPTKYGAKFKCEPYTDNVNALNRLKFERRLELAMEAERFFDLVRWGDAKTVLDKFYAGENNIKIYSNAKSVFVENKLEYMPIPFDEMQNANGLYKQNLGY